MSFVYYDYELGRHGQVVRQKPAKLLSPVQIRVSPFLVQIEVYIMGVIFGISDLPVSTIGSVIRIGGEVQVPQTVYREIGNNIPNLERSPQTDKFVSKKISCCCSNPVIKMRNGFGKLMSHFSKATIK